MPDIKDILYFKSPVWFQQIIVTGFGWWWYRRRFGKSFHKQVEELKKRESWTADQFNQYQERQLGTILEAAWNSPYYRQLFLDAGLSKGTRPTHALASLPILSKETLRTRGKDLLTLRTVPSGTMIQKSSGTTGTPTEIYFTEEMHAFELAMPEARNLNWAGVTYRDRRVMFGARKICNFDQNKPPYWRFSPAEDMAYASIYHLSPRNLPHYLEFLREFRPAVVMGYPNALAIVAQYAREHNDLPAPAKVVITTSETLTDYSREIIEAAWQCKVYDRYGAVECCMFASQCEFGRYHVSPDAGIIEIIDENGKPCLPGVLGEVVVTGLHNTLQPLIRYRVGDAARWANDQTCRCGREMPILEAIEGRTEDMCYTIDGRQVLRFDTVFKGVSTIKEAQVVQEQIDTFAINVVPAHGFDATDIEQLKNNMKLHVGEVQTVVRIVPEIPRTQSGKFRAVVCNLSHADRERLRNRENVSLVQR